MHGLGTFSFPFLLEPFNVALRSRLLCHPIEAQTFSEPVLYLVGGRSVTIAIVPDSVPLFVKIPDIPVVNFSDEDIEMQVAGSAGDDVERKRPEPSGGSDPSPIFMGRRTRFLGYDKAQVSHDLLNGPPYLETQRHLDGLSLNELVNFHDVPALKLVMSSNMFNREARSLSVEVLRLCNEIVTLKNQRADFVIVISRLEAKLLGVEGRLAISEDSVVCNLRAENERLFEEKEAVMHATETSLRAELEILKEKLDLTNEDHSLMVKDLLLHAVKTVLSSDSFSAILAGLQEKAMFVSRGRALKEVADMVIGFKLEDTSDYNSDADETYDKAIDNFYRVEFPYLDLLAYYAKKSLGLLKSLKPLFLPLHKSSSVGPSSSPFI
ncbi:hypothetical protein Tco_0436419 [Tanacetum coccineum]